MYKSPIELIYGGLQTQVEGEVFRAVQSVGVNVDKEELIKALEYDRRQYEKGYADATREHRWISVKDRLPEGETKVLVLTKHRTQLIVSYNPMFDRWVCGGNVIVTHWMPLPATPEEVKHE